MRISIVVLLHSIATVNFVQICVAFKTTDRWTTIINSTRRINFSNLTTTHFACLYFGNIWHKLELEWHAHMLVSATICVCWKSQKRWLSRQKRTRIPNLDNDQKHQLFCFLSARKCCACTRKEDPGEEMQQADAPDVVLVLCSNRLTKLLVLRSQHTPLSLQGRCQTWNEQKLHTTEDKLLRQVAETRLIAVSLPGS